MSRTNALITYGSNTRLQVSTRGPSPPSRTRDPAWLSRMCLHACWYALRNPSPKYCEEYRWSGSKLRNGFHYHPKSVLNLCRKLAATLKRADRSSAAWEVHDSKNPHTWRRHFRRPKRQRRSGECGKKILHENDSSDEKQDSGCQAYVERRRMAVSPLLERCVTASMMGVCSAEARVLCRTQALGH